MAVSSDFYSLGIAPNILGVLEKLDFKIPTPIQEKSIPPAILNKNLEHILESILFIRS